jgi:endonuclease/exonuclease/phosphatase (EEP) superfamily protein YafD
VSLNQAPTADPANDNALQVQKPRHRQWGSAAFWLLVGIGGLVAGRLGQLYPAFDVFSQFSAQFMAMAIAFCFAIFMPRFKSIFGIGLTLALLTAYGAWPHAVSTALQTPPYELGAGESTLRVAHYNTYKENQDYDAIANEVLRLDADVVSLVEMSNAKKKAVLPKLIGRFPHQYDCKEVDYCAISVISKFPIIESSGRAHWEGPPFAMVKLDGKAGRVTFLSVHMTRFPYSRAQLNQAQYLVKLLESVSEPVVVAGDFNATPFSRITTTLEKGANLQRMTELPTWPAQAGMPQLAIDHVFASTDFRVVANQQIGEPGHSDHYPILLTLAYRQKP